VPERLCFFVLFCIIPGYKFCCLFVSAGELRQSASCGRLQFRASNDGEWLSAMRRNVFVIIVGIFAAIEHMFDINHLFDVGLYRDRAPGCDRI
jgi:hypothetical protein